MAKYTIEDTTLIAIADSIRAKTGGVDGITPENMPTEIEGIKTGGGTEEIEQIIDQSGVLDSTEGTATEKVEQLIDKAKIEPLWYEMSKEIKSLNGLFYESQLIKKFPKGEYDEVTNANSCFQYSSLEEIDFYLNLITCSSASRMFADTANLKRIVGINTSKMANAQEMFQNSAIEVIEEPFDFTKISSNANKSNFSVTPNLREIRFVEGTLKYHYAFNSEHLSGESIQSIIGGLNSEVTGLTLTIPRAAVKKAFETSEGANDGDTSETWNALVASKPNWTIALS